MKNYYDNDVVLFCKSYRGDIEVPFNIGVLLNNINNQIEKFTKL